MSDTAALASNKKAREDAQEFMEFIEDQAGQQPLRFWEVLSELVSAKLPPKQPPVDRFQPLTESEAARFEAMPMPYGKHAGEPVGDVPCGYLLFLTEGDEFSQRLRRYVKTKRFQDRQ